MTSSKFAICSIDIAFRTAVTVVLLTMTAGCGNRVEHNLPSGTLEATEISLSPLLAGTVLEVGKREGDTVVKGDTLLRLDTEIIALQLDQNLAQSRELEAASSALQAQRRQAEIQAVNLEEKRHRQRQLLETGSATVQLVDDLTAQRDIARAQAAAADAQITANRAQSERLTAARRIIERQLRDGVLRAPSAGTVITRNVEPGESVTPQTTVFTIANLFEITLRIYLGERELSQVALGKEVAVRVDAFGKRTFRAKVTYISPVAEFTPKNVQTKKSRADLVFAVKLTIPNPEGALHAGMPAEAVL